jgi:propanol-preferring alcohol dehydrogenase
MAPIPEFDYRLLYHERIVHSVANSTREDCRELLALAPRIPIQTQVREFSRAEANRALLLLKQGQIQGAGVWRVG